MDNTGTERKRRILIAIAGLVAIAGYGAVAVWLESETEPTKYEAAVRGMPQAR
jgi:hypothetical protein